MKRRERQASVALTFTHLEFILLELLGIRLRVIYRCYGVKINPVWERSALGAVVTEWGRADIVEWHRGARGQAIKLALLCYSLEIRNFRDPKIFGNYGSVGRRMKVLRQVSRGRLKCCQSMENPIFPCFNIFVHLRRGIFGKIYSKSVN